MYTLKVRIKSSGMFQTTYKPFMFADTILNNIFCIMYTLKEVSLVTFPDTCEFRLEVCLHNTQLDYFIVFSTFSFSKHK